ncbi:tRNA (N(6)-L-threonylcarbamoyladenosine(37)-C(2))-methylthiotransferase [Methanococcus vannielii]|uniref:tRNA (N(6)-L-threonylcarbamoyladenosine(37)-C(2))- methylthiotransferase n=1 Tax=Methanococcus vannielii TaxID=2187 RepID=UPI000321A46A|nr:tRNA (N(6)-L-threonylcarbamoyladenosine(37)-C(2))-methylthiotransferase [Methanococcus vannielii]
MKIYIEGYGCTLNTADTEIIKNSIKEFQNFEITTDLNDSDIIVVNTCIVRQETEHRMISRIEYFKSLNKKVVVAGCMAKALPKKIEYFSDCMVLPREAQNSGNILFKKFIENKEKTNFENNLSEKLNKLSSKGLISPMPISEGCLGNCSYCIVKKARGTLESYDRKLIVKKAMEFINSGTKCLLITAQDTACYGYDNNDNLSNLIDDISEIPEKFAMRIGMMHAKFAEPILDELVESFKSEKVVKFLHLPIQSGDNQVLKDMGRNYTVDEFISVLNEFKRKIKDLNFTTDVIVGFPSETEDAFNNTLEVLKKIKPDFTHGAKYSQRKYTKAALLKQVDTKIRKERSEILNELRRDLSYGNNKRHIGQTFEILVTKNNMGVTENSKNVIFKDNAKIGEFRKVKISDANTFGLLGKLLE